MTRGRAARRRVAVTGLGCVSPLGPDAEATWAAAAAGAGAVAPLRIPSESLDPALTGVAVAAQCAERLPDLDMPAREARRLDRFTHLALAASAEAVADARLETGALDRDRVAVVVGSAVGGIGTLLAGHDTLLGRGARRVSPFTVPHSLANTASGAVSIQHGFRGPNLCPVGACAAGAQAIGLAVRMIERGEADAVVAGGAESAIHPLVLAGFAAMRALSRDTPERASRPFERDRDGFVIGEGAGVVVLESLERVRARGARIRAEVVGYGAAGDAVHLAAPDEDGAGARLAMRRALEDADLAPSRVDAINAHATGTPVGDRVEAEAIRAVFGDHGDRLPVSATKSMTGHLLGAAGAVEAILCVRALESGLLPPTIHLDRPDPACALDHVAPKARPAEVRVVLSNAFGFGGINAALLLGRGEEE